MILSSTDLYPEILFIFCAAKNSAQREKLLVNPLKELRKRKVYQSTTWLEGESIDMIEW